MRKSLHKGSYKTKVVTVVIVVVALLIFIGVLSWRHYFNNQIIEQTKVGNFTVSLYGSISWDNYCFPNRLEVQNSKHFTVSVTNVQLEGSPCGDITKWIQPGNFNKDGYTDFKLLHDTMNGTQNVYKTFVYQPMTGLFTAES